MKHVTKGSPAPESVQVAAKVNRSLMVPPAAILWTDADRHWESAIPQMAKQLPELFVLGDYLQQPLCQRLRLQP